MSRNSDKKKKPLQRRNDCCDEHARSKSTSPTPKGTVSSPAKTKQSTATSRGEKMEMELYLDRLRSELSKSDEACQKAARILEMWIDQAEKESAKNKKLKKAG